MFNWLACWWRTLSRLTRHTPPVSAQAQPQHIAIIMDGNGRWARRHALQRVIGHLRGLEAVRRVVKACVERNVPYLTLFAFSSENWRRPQEEISSLMELFADALDIEVSKLHDNNIKFQVIGNRSAFSPALLNQLVAAETLTMSNTKLCLSLAIDYGGRWDIMQAVNQMLKTQTLEHYSADDLTPYLSLSAVPEPDLFIRTGGEMRVSNFLLWQLAYTELYFTDTLWPDFDEVALDLAIASYRKRERRFGRISEQLHAKN